ncbi:MAG: sensor histidine kinase [Gammaproteobacteria bacterium]|nr:sensor histidine kinase [Gammaproteobacteria bacterium]
MAQKISQGRLFRKYFSYFVILVCGVLLASGIVGLYSSYRETRAALVALQREKALGAAARIEQFTREIEQQVGWTHMPQAGGPRAREQRHLDFLRLLRQAPAITDVSWLDRHGREQLKVSRLSMDRANSGADFSRAAKFLEPRQGATWFSPVYFHKETEPYMTIAMPAGQGGVTVAEVNLKFVWDVVSRIRVGESGYAYVVDARGRLVSHPDISRVLQKTDLSALPQVRAARAPAGHPGEEPDPPGSRDRDGQLVLAAHAVIAPLGWVVFVEQPLAEAYAPLYAAMARNGVLLLLGLALAVVASLALARRMVTPIQALRAGAQRIGAGALDANIEIRTGDELETLAEEFNHMAARLRESYAGLEQKVAERTQELAAANQAKVRFIAAASHDLRQPMHALGLFVAQLQGKLHDAEARRIAERVEAAVSALQELLDALLDISRLDAGTIQPNVSDFGVAPLLARIEANLAADAREKGLAFRVAPCRFAVRSDAMLLERILINLATNAVRYTGRGGVLLGCRRRGERVRIEVWDSGIGIAPEHQRAIFQEFYQVGNPERDRHTGIGLGLAIATRLARLLGGRIEVRSQPGKGSMFAVEVPRAAAVPMSVAVTPSADRSPPPVTPRSRRSITSSACPTRSCATTACRVARPAWR